MPMPKKQKAKIKQKNKCPEKLIRTEAAKEIAEIEKQIRELMAKNAAKLVVRKSVWKNCLQTLMYVSWRQGSKREIIKKIITSCVAGWVKKM